MKEEKFKHLTLRERQTISEEMNKGSTFTHIGKLIGKHRTTVARELQRHSVISYPKANRKGRASECIHKEYCTKTHCIGHKGCKDYEVNLCKRIVKGPYVCNGCSKSRSCRNIKFYYSARTAHNLYLKELEKSRKGLQISPEELARVNDLINNRIIKKKQSPYHIFANLEEELNMSLATFYRLVHAGLLETKLYHLPMAVRYKKRKKKRVLEPKTPNYKKGRTYKDFTQLIALTLPEDVVQMDTVIGKRNEPYAVLTFVFEKSNYLFAIKIERNISLSVRNVLKSLQQKLGLELYSKLFKIILTDNGGEFKVPEYIELIDKQGEVRSSVFYCDPYRAYQKGKIENAHRFIRRFIRKGRSLKTFTQKEINLMCNHINSVKRESLNGLSSYEAFSNQYGRHTAKLLGGCPIPSEKVCINESIFFT